MAALLLNERGLAQQNQTQSGAQGQPSGKLPLPPLGVIALSRLAFGPSPSELTAFQALGSSDEARLSAYLDAQLHPEKIDDGDCETRLAGMKLESLNLSGPQLYQNYYVKAPTNGDARWQRLITPALQVRRAALVRMIYSRRQLFEVLVNFWRDHFNVDPDKDERIHPLLPSFEATLRKHAFGNFRTLLGAVSQHPCMLYFLDNASSSRAGPNENFARELFELHTLGAAHYLGVGRQSGVKQSGGLPIGYVDDDVYEATRAFTGWRVADNTDDPGLGNTGAFTFYPPWHDRFQKSVLGEYLAPNAGIEDGNAVLDRLATHPGTAQHIAQKLCRRLVADDPPDALVARAAAVFLAQRRAPDQLKQVISAIVRSPEFAQSWGQKIKRPLEATAASLRALNAQWTPSNDNLWIPDWMGQGLYAHPAPDGPADFKEVWSGSLNMLRRWQLARALTHNWNDFIKVDLQGQHPKTLLTPGAVTDFWARRLLGRSLGTAGRAAVMRQLAGDGDLTSPLQFDVLKDRLMDAVALIVISPEFQAS